MKKILLIQTAFIGDVILATALIESIKDKYPHAEVDFVLRKGNESLFHEHPKINKIYIWDKKNGKYSNLKKVISEIRQTKYDVLFNLQRFGASGWMSWRAKAKKKIGFRKNPFSFCYDAKVSHEIGNGKHEIERNFDLLAAIGDFELKKPALYPSEEQINRISSLFHDSQIVVMAPSSVWFTKQLPEQKWLELMSKIPKSVKICLIGGPDDRDYLEKIRRVSQLENVSNLAGEISLLESVALIQRAERTYVNDSAPLHLASSVNAPVTAFFCSTIPDFGFGPLSDDAIIVEVNEKLKCRPCGLHGKSSCPKGHFDCGNKIQVTI